MQTSLHALRALAHRFESAVGLCLARRSGLGGQPERTQRVQPSKILGSHNSSEMLEYTGPLCGAGVGQHGPQGLSPRTRARNRVQRKLTKAGLAGASGRTRKEETSGLAVTHPSPNTCPSGAPATSCPPLLSFEVSLGDFSHWAPGGRPVSRLPACHC